MTREQSKIKMSFACGNKAGERIDVDWFGETFGTQVYSLA